MTVKELIDALEKLDPKTRVFREVDGEATRTGDYFPAHGLRKLQLRPLNFGGYEEADEPPSAYVSGPAVYGVLIC